MYNDIQPEIRGVVEPVVQAHGLELVDATLKQGSGKSQLQIIVDTPAGDGRVNVGACAAVSREVGHGLEAGAVVPGAYLLEVCSPGVDRVLGRAIDFERNVGREVKLETSRPHGGRRRFRGELVGFEDRTAAVRIEDQAFHIPFELISQAKAFYPFETTGARK